VTVYTLLFFDINFNVTKVALKGSMGWLLVAGNIKILIDHLTVLSDLRAHAYGLTSQAITRLKE